MRYDFNSPVILLYLWFSKAPEYYEGRNEGWKKREWDAAYQVWHYKQRPTIYTFTRLLKCKKSLYIKIKFVMTYAISTRYSMFYIAKIFVYLIVSSSFRWKCTGCCDDCHKISTDQTTEDKSISRHKGSLVLFISRCSRLKDFISIILFFVDCWNLESFSLLSFGTMQWQNLI